MPEINYVEITQFNVITTPDNNFHILGKGTDGWMYEYRGNEGTWVRLSEKVPHTIYLPGSESLLTK